MSDKVREEFEVWFAKELVSGEITKTYCWQAWKASRAAVVVELPVVNVYETGYVGANHKAYDCEEVKDALSKEGVKYK